MNKINLIHGRVYDFFINGRNYKGIYEGGFSEEHPVIVRGDDGQPQKYKLTNIQKMKSGKIKALEKLEPVPLKGFNKEFAHTILENRGL